jgi:hypothetical protein
MLLSAQRRSEPFVQRSARRGHAAHRVGVELRRHLATNAVAEDEERDRRDREKRQREASAKAHFDARGKK